MSVKKIAILFSGTGSNLLNLLENLHNKTFNNTTIQITLTITNKANAGGIKHAQRFGLEPVVIEHKNFNSREEFDAVLVDEIKKANVDLTVLAGFMRILTPVFTKNIKAINLHPSILPLFKGAHAIENSFESGMKLGGVSVHFVSDELDGGEIIAQEAFQKGKLDLESYTKKIHQIEHEILPKAVINLLT